MKVVSYLGGIPAKNKNENKPKMLKSFAEGVNAAGDEGIIHHGMSFIPADVGVIQGFVHDHGKTAPHLQFRKRCIDSNPHSVIIDSNMFSYHTGGDCKMCRYSFDGVFPTTGNYCDEGVGTEHWDRISKNYGIQLKPWKKSGNHILICLQRNGGWSMKGEDVKDWARKTVSKIRNYSQRPIVIRSHPGDGKSYRYMNEIARWKGVTVSENKTLLEDLQNAWCTVVKNSSPSVGSVMEGVPVFVDDPIDCQAGPVANTIWSNIDNPEYHDRQEWLNKICASHWDIPELLDGSCWRHMRQFVQ